MITLMSCGHWLKDGDDFAHHGLTHPHAFPLGRVADPRDEPQPAVATHYEHPFAIFPELQEATRNLAKLVDHTKTHGLGTAGVIDLPPDIDALTDDDALAMFSVAVCFIADPMARAIMAKYGLTLGEEVTA